MCGSGVWCSAASSDIEIGAHSRAHMTVTLIQWPGSDGLVGREEEGSQLASVGLCGVERKFAAIHNGKEEGIIE